MAKPTILTFHGSGSNDTIHSLRRVFSIYLVFLGHTPMSKKKTSTNSMQTGPIESAAGPGVLPFFDGCGPFYRWVPPSEALSAAKMRDLSTLTTELLPEVSSLVKSAVANAKARGSEVVGVIGFSQGTRVVAGLLKAAQIRRELLKEGKAEGLEWCDFKFGVSVCSSFPPPLVPVEVVEAVKKCGLDEARQKEMLEAKITLPAIHMLGKQDEWRWAGKLLIESAYEVESEPKDEVEKGKNGVFEFVMGHHYPVQSEDTEKVANWVIGTWEETKGL
ncbi:uncharacterized protein N0V89_001471 [Didymosphaeria variabile]|uniref:Serine hydrolase domain-containing protein n=1 Tax=Didymosphaeria variabile TaxID=1932322 RepID=A0A9W9CGS2_9PLEO|nr:uncharacterized protein N0V89_001471 [Didymosphaeria variabile]KAJ4360902.1 hypothetical protein N0V89_001471 [Didymosphaeria variabile]